MPHLSGPAVKLVSPFSPAATEMDVWLLKRALFFPLQSVQVLWTRRAAARQDCGGVGQRDQRLVSEKAPSVQPPVMIYRLKQET